MASTTENKETKRTSLLDPVFPESRNKFSALLDIFRCRPSQLPVRKALLDGCLLLSRRELAGLHLLTRRWSAHAALHMLRLELLLKL